MSKNELIDSPFLINKSTLKFPLRSVTGYGYVESRNKAMLQKSMRKIDSYNYANEPERHHKDIALEYLRKKREFQDSKKTEQVKMRKKFNMERDLDDLSRAIVAEAEFTHKLDYIYAESKNPEPKKSGLKTKGYNANNKDQKLRQAIYESLTEEKVKVLFENYKKFYFSHKMRHLDDEERNEMEQFLKVKENEIKDFEDYYVLNALKMADMDVKSLIKVPETVTKKMNMKQPTAEPMKELEEIIKRSLEATSKQSVSEYEQKYWIDVFQTVDLAITNFKFQKQELRYKRMNNFLDVIARPYIIYKQAEAEFKRVQSQTITKPERFNRDKLRSEQSQRSTLSNSLRFSKEWRFLKNELSNNQFPIVSSPNSRPESRASSEPPLSFFITNPRGLPEEIPKVIKVSSIINSNNHDTFRVPLSARTAIIEEKSEMDAKESPKMIDLIERRAHTAARSRRSHNDYAEAPTARTSSPKTAVYERSIHERGKSAESIWKTSMLLSERPHVSASRAVKQDFRNFYDKYGELMTENTKDTKTFLKEFDQQVETLEKEIKEKVEVTMDTVLMNAVEPDTIEFKSKFQLKKKVISKLVESIENKDEVLGALQKRKSTDLLKTTMQKNILGKAAVIVKKWSEEAL